MKAKVYDDFIVNITDSNNVHIVSNTGVATLPLEVIDLLTRETGLYNMIKADFNRSLTDANDEIHRQRGVIKDLEGDLAKAIDNNVTLSARIVELEKSLVAATVDDKDIVIGVACKAVGHKIVHLDGEFIADCGTSRKAGNVARALYEGKVTVKQVKLLFNDKDISKKIVGEDNE